MKRLYPSIFLAAIVISAIAATVKISDLPISTSPSTNTFLEIADMDAVTKSSKYLLTNLVTQSAFTAATNSLTTSAANWTASGTTNSTLTGVARANGGTFTNGITAGASTFTDAVAFTPSTVAYSSSISASFSGPFSRWTTLDGDLTVTSADLAAGRGFSWRIDNPKATNCNLILPSGWRFVSGTITNILATSKVGVLAVRSYSTSDTNVICTWSSE